MGVMLISNNSTVNKARKLRKNMTEAEKKLWHYLRDKQFTGLKFRIQQAIGNYIVDFVCFEKNLIIKIDGGQHNKESEYEDERTGFLESEGFKILRFWNNNVLKNIEGVPEVNVSNCSLRG